MAAVLSLNRFELLWLLEGGARGSHLRWSVYETFVNNVYPQLSEDEREAIYTYAKRDLSYMFDSEFNKSAAEHFNQFLARFNPANQYIVTVSNGKKKVVADNAYLWNGRYYISWYATCSDEYITKVEKKPYKKCQNQWCKSKDKCIRFTEYKEGDALFDDNAGDFVCDKCDCIINEIEKNEDKE